MESRGKKLWLSSTALKIALIAIIAFVAGYFLKSLSQHPAGAEHEHPGQQAVTQEQTWWTCSMHPQIRQPKPGKCPICFMDLIPVSTAGGEIGQQTTCPVMGLPINKDLFTVYKGKKVYFCCPGCKPEFEKNPEKYLAKLPQFKKKD